MASTIATSFPGSLILPPGAEEVGHASNCIMVKAINQSGSAYFLGSQFGRKRCSRDEENFFACILNINEFRELIAERKER